MWRAGWQCGARAHSFTVTSTAATVVVARRAAVVHAHGAARFRRVNSGAIASGLHSRAASTHATTPAVPPSLPVPPSAPLQAVSENKDVRAQELFYIRSSASSPADAMDMWAISSSKMKSWITARRAGLDVALVGGVQDLSSIVKRPSDSLLTVVLPFGSDPALRRHYINFRGQLRVGKLLEEIDAFAGNIAYLHCDDGDATTEPPLLVTVSTDRVDLLTYPLPADRDLQLKGMVTYTGTSSINVELDLTTRATVEEPQPQPLMFASLTFVARSRANTAIPVPRLSPTTPFEKAMYAAGKRSQEERKAARARSLERSQPSQEELCHVHTLFQSLPALTRRSGRGALQFLDEGRYMFTEDTGVTTVHITMPQDKNIHNKVFGGFLMRQAFETAWACGWKHTGVPPKFLALDDIMFLHPVEVGTLLRFDACMVFTPGPPSKTYSVSVKATTMTPGGDCATTPTSGETLTNTFHFTFYCDDPARIPTVFPRTYEDAMNYIEAGRRYLAGRGMAEKRKAEGGVTIRFT